MTASTASRVPVRRAYVDGRFGQLHYRIATPTAAAGTASVAGAGRRPLLCLLKLRLKMGIMPSQRVIEGKAEQALSLIPGSIQPFFRAYRLPV